MIFYRLFLSVPGWLMMQGMRPLMPTAHPWKKGKSLWAWVNDATDTCLLIGAVFWWGLLCCLFEIALLLEVCQ